MSDPIGLPYTVNPLELADRDALIEVREGPTGEMGPQGGPAWPWTWEGDIADFATLEGLPLTTADARKAWRVVAENAIYVWTGLDWVRFLDAFLAPGRQGPANELTGAAVAGAVGSSASAQFTGTAPGQVLEITFPRGVTGPAGDPGVAGAIADAEDVADISDASDGSILSWNSADDLWYPVPAPKLAGPWSIAGSQFAAASNVSATERTVATMTIPAQSFAYRPIVIAGQINIKAATKALDDPRLIVEVRLGSASGPVIGFGMPIGAPNNTNVLLAPRWEQALTPESTHATVAANQTSTIYVVITRVSGTKTYTVVNQGAQLMIMAQPLKDQS
ncbi:hypothetical protein IU448_15270 [Nocardia flavorosea]|uniref:hypothetical protein n=1 Tax=Nocardia flavorosea TaxID=53429 RepID=UPI001895E52B|nr:hypothetical protein [Nocardia flavorosea]MBF6350367.1 hypothetical protein [Nocardia flavorosea]